MKGEAIRVFISVVLPAYNDERWLREAVDSVLAQTHRDFELLLIDDGSTDGTLAIMQAYAAQDERVRVFTHENWGVARTRNDATSHTRGDWIAVMDADDVMRSTRFERQLAFIQAHPEVAVASCLAYLINEGGEVIGQTTTDLLTAADCARYVSEKIWFGVTHSGVMMRKDVLLAAGGYREKLRYAPDTDLWFRISEAGGLILVQPERLMLLRKHLGSVSARSIARIREPIEHGHWIYACMQARRAGQPEPSLDEFRAAQTAAPFFRRLDYRRQSLAEYWYRVGVLHWGVGSKLKAVRYSVGALLLRPEESALQMVSKLRGSLFRRGAST